MKGKARRIWSNLAKVDATPGVPDDEIPEITREDLDRATLSIGGVVVRGPRRRGRPLGSGKKAPIHVRIDKDILAHFRATGRGWQTRLNAALRTAVEGQRPAKAAKRRRAG
jgi:uncharacterized protein (DUF4415 family)